MRMRPLVFGLCGTAAVAGLAAAGMQLAGGVPARASGAATSAAAGHVRPGHVATGAATRGGHAESATVVLHVQAGATVTITGGGSRSNCTTDETSKTMTVTSVPLIEAVGLVARTSGSCQFEPSWSNFQVTVANGGKVILARAILLGGANPLSYSASCDAAGGTDQGMSCAAAGRDELDLTQRPETAAMAGPVDAARGVVVQAQVDGG